MTKSRKLDPEMMAMCRAWGWIEPLAVAARRRVIEYLSQRIGDDNRDELTKLLKEGSEHLRNGHPDPLGVNAPDSKD